MAHIKKQKYQLVISVVFSTVVFSTFQILANKAIYLSIISSRYHFILVLNFVMAVTGPNISSGNNGWSSGTFPSNDG